MSTRERSAAASVGELRVELRQVKQQARERKAALQSLTDSVLVYLGEVDRLVAADRRIPRDVSAGIARLANALETANDLIRYGSLRIDFRKDDKAKATAKILRRVGG